MTREQQIRKLMNMVALGSITVDQAMRELFPNADLVARIRAAKDPLDGPDTTHYCLGCHTFHCGVVPARMVTKCSCGGRIVAYHAWQEAENART